VVGPHLRQNDVYIKVDNKYTIKVKQNDVLKDCGRELGGATDKK